ncbi:MAG TPA: hypothetical protein VGM21_15910 [Actinomycetota bacterium]|jgi:hypothetical protein
MNELPARERLAGPRRWFAAFTRLVRRRGGGASAAWYLGDPVVPALHGWPVAPPGPRR